jgi:hypothetical protein
MNSVVYWLFTAHFAVAGHTVDISRHLSRPAECAIAIAELKRKLDPVHQQAHSVTGACSAVARV